MKTNNQDTELKPCPFCGGESRFDVDGRYVMHVIATLECAISAVMFTPKDWNTRHEQ